ncbi:protein POLLEN DEFECTIVE IN GUIDANCE 1-like isoform X1 [Gossypium raimondii]|uniref:protein POLLEN DEFECTIVE IN GUIDANCE 1-like isoform X1 n=1 Tax=Gossypium raimondii TaxID=29730 RepID=UPI00227A9304|nr:protein POLLEN DEFECTIVE IN GUIDANCE 1-like isoform X1 [Gossypium raimondii]XP_052480793.1 protein POLLEN DEFECTIVE IN GUIDANCE 1-like isoform X1 [Gossypium raimondii]
MYSGNSLRRTTTLGSEKERERVYDTIFRLPCRCEVLIDVGFFVCFDVFLSLLTIMLTRILIKLWRFLTARQFKRLSAAELCDFGCFLVLACGVILLSQTDISLIYHMVRGQGTIKLYMIYNVLECFLLQLISSGQAEKSTSFSSSMMRIFQHGLLRQRDKEAPRLTESGFQFLLMDTNAQLWYIIREYISNSEVYLMR